MFIVRQKETRNTTVALLRENIIKIARRMWEKK